MKATPFTTSAARIRPASGWVVPLAIALGLGTIVGARLFAVRAGLDPLLVGAGFGGALAALAALALAGRHPRTNGARALLSARAGLSAGTVSSILAGIVVGLVLVAIAVIGPAIGGVLTAPGLGRPAAPFVPWALVTLLVAAAEEGVLRGALLDRLEHVAGLAPAIALTTLAFALIHVPLYGWHVVPLDLAVGLVLAGLRISTRGLAAPIAAHAVADLATWWL
jgi:membrane protease YdiL (CAAX protease family)